jgi:Integrase core domain
MHRRGSCFTTGAFARACAALGAQHRTTKPYTPETTGMAERFNGRIEREVLTITVGSHRDLERLLKGYSQAYNARPQRVLNGRSPDEVARSRLAEKTKLDNSRHKPPIPASWPKPCGPSKAQRRSRDQTRRLRAEGAAAAHCGGAVSPCHRCWRWRRP